MWAAGDSPALANSVAESGVGTSEAEPFIELHASGDESQPGDATAFDPNEFENFSFDFGAADSELEASVIDSGTEAEGLHDSRRDASATDAEDYGRGSPGGAADWLGAGIGFSLLPFLPLTS